MLNHNLLDYGINECSLFIKTKNKSFCEGNKHTLYDLASITKLFTLNLLYNLKKIGIISFSDKINKYLKFPYLDYCIYDFIKMNGTIETDGKLSETSNYKKFLERLTTVKKVDIKNKYTDIGYIILGLLIEKVTKKSLKDNFEELFEYYDLKETKILKCPSDPKAKICGGVNGAAGIFSTINDLEKYALKIINYEIFSKEFILELQAFSFIDDLNRKRSYSGSYLYTENARCYVPKIYSKSSLAFQGYTGCALIIDFSNYYINILLFDALHNNVKYENFFDIYYELQEKISLKTIS